VRIRDGDRPHGRPGLVLRLVTGRGRGRLPTTADGAEQCLIILFLGQRALALAQLAAALPAALASAHRPGLDAALAALFLLESAALATVVIGRGAYRSTRLAAGDVAFGVMLLLAEAVTVRLDGRFTSWAGWGFPVSLGAAAGAAIAMPRLRQVMASVACLVVAYLAVTLVPATNADQVSTSVTNAVAYVGFAAVLRGLSGFLRRLANDADQARKQAGWLAAHAERNLHRQLLHDQAAVLGLLSEQVPESLAGALRVQAAQGAARIRWFLAEDDVESTTAGSAVAAPTHHPRRLAGSMREQVLATCATFSDLPVVANADLVVREPPMPVVVALVEALATLLHNVRRHALAQEVVVHVESDEVSWELVVRDDGVGFDPAQTSLGYGLRRQVLAVAGEVGGQVSISSEVCVGTAVRLWGPAA